MTADELFKAGYAPKVYNINNAIGSFAVGSRVYDLPADAVSVQEVDGVRVARIEDVLRCANA